VLKGNIGDQNYKLGSDLDWRNTASVHMVQTIQRELELRR